MQSLRVIIVGTAWPYRGGLASYNERLAQELQARGHRVTIHTFTLQYPAVLFPGKSQYTDDPPPADLEIVRSINAINPLTWWTAGRAIRREQPDLIICKFWLPFMGPSLGTVLRVARTARTQVLSIIDNIIPHERRPGDEGFARYFVRAVDSFIVMSHAVGEEMQQFVQGQPVVYSPHPIFDNYGPPVDRATALAHLQLPSRERYLLFFGFIRDYKGLDLLLRALARPEVQALGVKLIVAGEYYGNQAAYESLIEELQLAERVVLHTDYIPNEEVRYYFGAADVVVQPYKTATQSGISQVAYHFGKPMIVTHVGGLPEIVPDGEAGYVVAVDPEAIAEAIVRFYSSGAAERLAAGVRARQAYYSWGHMAEKIESLYQQGHKQ